MAKIHIKNLLLRAYIGFNTEETSKLQDVIINIHIEIDLSRAIESDTVNDSYNYRTVTKEVIKLVQDQKFNMLERLTQSVLDTIMADERVFSATVEVDKPHALRFAESVSIELEASRDE